jgi:hypothetical protein
MAPSLNVLFQPSPASMTPPLDVAFVRNSGAKEAHTHASKNASRRIHSIVTRQLFELAIKVEHSYHS